jgi:hypothetical protein
VGARGPAPTRTVRNGSKTRPESPHPQEAQRRMKQRGEHGENETAHGPSQALYEPTLGAKSKDG